MKKLAIKRLCNSIIFQISSRCPNTSWAVISSKTKPEIKNINILVFDTVLALQNFQTCLLF